MNVTLIAVGSRPWEYWRGHWGLSYLIDDTILFDAFYDYAALDRGLCRAKVNVDAIDTVVISHNHWDHIDGLWPFLERRPGVRVYLPTDAGEKVRARVKAAGGQLVEGAGLKELKPNVALAEEMIGSFKEGTIAEHYLVLKGERGLTLIVGCAHPGILNMVRQAKAVFKVPIYGVFGGFHLFRSGSRAAYACAKDLKAEGLTMVAPTHCTGWIAEWIFRFVFGKGFLRVRKGKTVTV